MATIEIETQVRRFEKVLGVKFPGSYHQFLMEHDSALIDGFQILGLTEKEETEEKEERLDLTKIAESASCPVCQKQKSAGKITCYNCYNRYSRETNRELPLSQWVKDNLPKKEEKPKEKELSVLDATLRLRQNRLDLPKTLVPICVQVGRAMCLETKKIKDDDCPLIDVSLNKDEPSIPVGNTFGEWLQIHQEYERRFKEAYARVERRRITTQKVVFLLFDK
ncbi:SMI1/KNR4 family protein [Patescibacteria group bacterium]|nr:SMI1/KNR4 family protein [Patescibacteria group bacterium]MBU4462098.1 SMI1/KNR4 family protein [Patescibacteria group bacterium]MCG2700417.1 SMI1/KNR4 family protein [Candidatus Parcubacteria bacterium]